MWWIGVFCRFSTKLNHHRRPVRDWHTGQQQPPACQGHNFPDGYWYCHVDDTGGIRLYDRFEYAINGGKTNALPLVQPSADQQIYIPQDENYNGVAQIQRWTMTTDRGQLISLCRRVSRQLLERADQRPG